MAWAMRAWICSFFFSSLASRIAFIRFMTRSSRSGTATGGASSLAGFGCLLTGVRVFILTGSATGSTRGSATVSVSAMCSNTILAFALALDLALGLASTLDGCLTRAGGGGGPITSSGGCSVSSRSSDGVLGSSYSVWPTSTRINLLFSYSL